MVDITKRRIREVYKDKWDETRELPRILQRELLRDWIVGEKIPDFGQNYSKERWMPNWNSIRPWTAQKFISVQSLDHNDLPPFSYEWNCIIWDYYKQSRPDEFRRDRLCHFCYGIVSKFYKQYAGNVWKENKWRFYHVTDHSKVSEEDLLSDVVWNPDNWCERCYIEPLFDILHIDDCRDEYHYHCKRVRRRLDFSSDESSCDEYCQEEEKRIRGSFVDECFYKLIKKDPFYW